MVNETRKFLHDTIAVLLGLAKSSVIWNRQNGYKQATPLVTLMAYSEQGEAMADMLPTENDGEYDLKTPTQFVLEVLCNSTTAPLWVRGSSLEKACSAVGWASWFQST